MDRKYSTGKEGQKMIRTCRRLLLLLVLSVSIGGILFPASPAQAIDPVKIVLPAVSDRSRYNDPNLNASLLNQLSSQFRFPKYEILSAPALKNSLDQAALEKLVAEKSADGAVALEISHLRNFTYYLRDETIEETDITLTLAYFDKKTGRFGRFKAVRSATEFAGIYSGPLPLAQEATEELLNRLDAIFPRQFPGPRY